VEFAPHGARLLAYIIDSFIVGIGLAIVAALMGLILVAFASTGPRSGIAVVALLAIVLFVALSIVAFAYFPYFWSHGGQTPGMKAMGLWVVRDRDGGPVELGTAILRLIGLWVSGAVFYLGFIWIFIDERRRGWHDLIAGTAVIARR
jgi:uncharacterized RDD family membrane protein YckC